MVNKKTASCILLLLLAVLAGYFIKPATTTRPATITESQPIDVVTNQKIPECYAGRCPEYFSMDVDTDDLAESVVIVPTSMSQGAGKIMIIKKGRVIFESDDLMRINVIQTKKQVKEGNGFTILYGKEVNSNVGSEIRYIYQDGKFISEEEEECSRNNGVWVKDFLEGPSCKRKVN